MVCKTLIKIMQLLIKVEGEGDVDPCWLRICKQEIGSSERGDVNFSPLFLYLNYKLFSRNLSSRMDA